MALSKKGRAAETKSAVDISRRAAGRCEEGVQEPVFEAPISNQLFTTVSPGTQAVRSRPNSAASANSATIFALKLHRAGPGAFAEHHRVILARSPGHAHGHAYSGNAHRTVMRIPVMRIARSCGADFTRRVADPTATWGRPVVDTEAYRIEVGAELDDGFRHQLEQLYTMSGWNAGEHKTVFEANVQGGDELYSLLDELCSARVPLVGITKAEPDLAEVFLLMFLGIQGIGDAVGGNPAAVGDTLDATIVGFYVFFIVFGSYGSQY